MTTPVPEVIAWMAPKSAKDPRGGAGPSPATGGRLLTCADVGKAAENTVAAITASAMICLIRDYSKKAGGGKTADFDPNKPIKPFSGPFYKRFQATSFR